MFTRGREVETGGNGVVHALLYLALTAGQEVLSFSRYVCDSRLLLLRRVAWMLGTSAQDGQSSADQWTRDS